MNITLLAHDMAKTAEDDSYSFDTDGIPFIIDNSATGAICNDKSLFIGPLRPCKIVLGTAEGIQTKTRHVGTLRLKLRDDDGKEWTYDIPEVVYDPDSPFCLLGIPFLGDYFGKDDRPNTSDEDGTWIRSSAF